MHLLCLWALLTFLARHGCCAPSDQLEMVQWERMEGDGTGVQEWEDEKRQTWSAVIEDPGNGEVLTYNGLKDIIEQQFNYVYEQLGRPTDRVCMVAAFYEASSRTVYSSSVPYGGRKRVMQLTAARDAPVWFNKVSSMARVNPQWHAEDGAYYTYEVTTDHKPPGPRYAPGSMVAAYGIREEGDNIGPHPLCGSAPRRTPSCSEVAAQLGIAQTQPRPPPPPALVQNANPNTDVDMDGGILDSDLTVLADQLDELCPIQQNQQSRNRRWSVHRHGLERRANSSSCITVLVQTSAPVIKLSASLPSSDFAMNSDSSTLTSPPITSAPTSQPSPQMPLTPLSNCEWEGDPDEYGAPGCGCEGYSAKLPALPGTDSCAYTAVPASIGALRTTDTSINPTNPFPCTSTDLSNGIFAAYAEQAQIPGFAGVQCTGANSPISTLPPVPSSTVFIGNHSFNVGKTFGDPLYSGISSLLGKACPTGGSCDLSHGKWKIGGVTTYDALDKAEDKDAGSVVMNILDSSYTPQLLPALIVRAASAVNYTAQGDQMCFTTDTCRLRYTDGCSRENVFCRATDYVAVVTQEGGSGNGQIAAHLEIELEFDHKSDPFEKDICDLVVATVEAGPQLLGLELEPADVAATGKVGALYREGQALASDVSAIVAVASGTG